MLFAGVAPVGDPGRAGGAHWSAASPLVRRVAASPLYVFAGAEDDAKTRH